MLNELIFLGQIPGTNFYLSFFEIAVAIELTMLLIFSYLLYSLRHRIRDSFSLQNPVPTQATVPAQVIGRIGLALLEDSAPDQIDLFAFPIPQDA